MNNAWTINQTISKFLVTASWLAIDIIYQSAQCRVYRTECFQSVKLTYIFDQIYDFHSLILELFFDEDLNFQIINVIHKGVKLLL